MKGPILITGAGRNGSTLLAQILNVHPQLNISYDKAHFFRFYLDSAFPIEENYKRIISEARDRLRARFTIDVPYERIISRIEESSKITFATVYDTFMIETFCNGSRDVRWGERSLLQLSNIPLFLQMFEDSQVLHIMRDPRDALASMRRWTWEEPHRYLNVVFNCLYSMNWAQTRRGVLPEDRYKIVVYEEYVKNPESQIGEICQFLEVPFYQEMLNSDNFKDGLGNPWQPDTAFGDIKEGISKQALQRWKSSLENWEILFTESILGHLLEPFGYEPSGLKFTAEDLATIWERIRETPLIQSRLEHWFNTGEGVELLPSDPRDPKNWDKNKSV